MRDGEERGFIGARVCPFFSALLISGDDDVLPVKSIRGYPGRCGLFTEEAHDCLFADVQQLPRWDYCPRNPSTTEHQAAPVTL